MPETVRVDLGECSHPGTPHPAGHWVTLTPVLTNEMGMAARTRWLVAKTVEDLRAGLAVEYLRYGIRAWHDERPVRTPLPIELLEEVLPFGQGGSEVIDAADELYSEDFWRPLVRKIAKPSEPSPTDESTSATKTNGAEPPVPIKRSSPKSTAGKRSIA